MRNAFVQEIVQLAANDPRIVILSGDIGNRLFDSFKEQFPDRFFNCGIAEANMVTMAAGMALNGLRPFCYTITPFITSRCFEQIKIDICYHNLPVTIVGVGSGFSYAELGATHHSFEDIACLRVLPQMSIICPCDQWEVRSSLGAILKQDGPAYLRIGKKGEPQVHMNEPAFVLGESILLRGGQDVCICGTGSVLPLAMQVAESLEKRQVAATVYSTHTVKPLNETMLAKMFSEFPVVVTIEEHSSIGGFGASFAEWLADNPFCKGYLLRFGFPDKYFCEVGKQKDARDWGGLTVEKMENRILEFLAEIRQRRCKK